MKNIGECKLCKNTCELKESHIIPRWVYRFVRDKNLNNEFIERFNKRDKIIKDGPKEFLLCDPCEQLIGNKYEKYFKEAIHLGRHGVSKSLDDKYLTIENLDYKKSKLFLLSLLWKASISSRPEFDNVKLNNSEEVIRKMILNENPGGSSEFTIIGFFLLMNNENQDGWATNFQEYDSKYGLPPMYGILIGGIFYLISCSGVNESFTKNNILNESGRWIMSLLEWSKIRFLRESAQEHYNKNHNLNPPQ